MAVNAMFESMDSVNNGGGAYSVGQLIQDIPTYQALLNCLTNSYEDESISAQTCAGNGGCIIIFNN